MFHMEHFALLFCAFYRQNTKKAYTSAAQLCYNVFMRQGRLCITKNAGCKAKYKIAIRKEPALWEK